MLDPNKLDELANKIGEAIPSSAKAFQEEIREQCKQILQSVITKMDLVTREEFDRQSKVLAKTRLKVEELEKIIASQNKAKH